MKKVFIIIALFISSFSYGQKQTSIQTIDFIKIKNNKTKEALFFYENNWKVYRDIAVKKGFIKSYKILKTVKTDSVADFDLMLVTEYADSSKYKLSEENFQSIIKTTRPTGSKLLNELQPADFRQILFFKKTETLFDSSKK